MQRLQRLGIVAHQLQRTPEEVGEMIFLRHLDLSGSVSLVFITHLLDSGVHQEQVRRAPADERCLSLQEALPSGIPGHLRMRPQGAPFPASCEERSVDACVD